MKVVRRSPWYSSFYWRIAVSFVVLVIVVLAAQSVMFSYLLARNEASFRPPNTIAAGIARDVSAAMLEDSAADVGAVLSRYRDTFQGAYVVTRDGRVIANTSRPLADDIRADTIALLTGVTPSHAASRETTGPVVTAPIVVANELRGMVVMPPPPRRGMLADIGRLLSLPGTLVLIAATTIAAIVIFAPARRRLQELERAADQLGRGNLHARAPEGGRDEIASVARAFNQMASDLAARDEALRTSDRLRRQMFADVSHELKTPLTAMRGYLDTLHMPDIHLDQATRNRYLETVELETRRLERIVKDLLDLARYENGVARLDERVFAVERVFEAVIRRHEREASDRGIELRAEVHPSIDQVTGDPDRLEQVVENLVANALRHTPNGGRLELRATAIGDAWTITVTDSGTGIAPEHLPHVFDRFYKVDSSRMAAAGGGSGLGLSIAKAIVERHGGRIGVTSQPGRTEFAIVLPQRR
jgi:signal transduction histidine kinase